MTDLRTALRRLNDAAHEALKAAKNEPGFMAADHVTIIRIIIRQTDRMVDEAAPNACVDEDMSDLFNDDGWTKAGPIDAFSMAQARSGWMDETAPNVEGNDGR